MTVWVILVSRIFSRIFYITDDTVIGRVVFFEGKPVLDLFFFFSDCSKKSLPQILSSFYNALVRSFRTMYVPDAVGSLWVKRV